MYDEPTLSNEFELSNNDVAVICMTAATGCNALFSSPLVARIAATVSEALDGDKDIKFVGAGQDFTSTPELTRKRFVVDDVNSLSACGLRNLKYAILFGVDSQFIIGAPRTVRDKDELDLEEKCREEYRWDLMKDIHIALDIKYDCGGFLMMYTLEYMIGKAKSIRKGLELYGGSPWSSGYDIDSNMDKLLKRGVLTSVGRARATNLGLTVKTDSNAKTMCLVVALGMYGGKRPDVETVDWIRHIRRYWV